MVTFNAITSRARQVRHMVETRHARSAKRPLNVWINSTTTSRTTSATSGNYHMNYSQSEGRLDSSNKEHSPILTPTPLLH